MKKFISLLLTLCMLATMGIVPAFADAGTYTGVGNGKAGEGSIEVAVTIDDEGHITGIEVTKDVDGEDGTGMSSIAIAAVTEQIVTNDTLAVDAASGATLTSQGILQGADERYLRKRPGRSRAVHPLCRNRAHFERNAQLGRPGS